MWCVVQPTITGVVMQQGVWLDWWIAVAYQDTQHKWVNMGDMYADMQSLQGSE